MPAVSGPIGGSTANTRAERSSAGDRGLGFRRRRKNDGGEPLRSSSTSICGDTSIVEKAVLERIQVDLSV